jgi:hypothetical protein
MRKVKAALAHSDEVYIFSARVCPGSDWKTAQHATQAMAEMAESSRKLFGTVLPITCLKAWDWHEIWDDRAKQVIPNTGEFLEDHIPELAAAMK